MKYKDTAEAVFIKRNNRFSADVMIGGVMETVHIKNTGRLKELLTFGRIVILEKADNPERKTKYSLIAVRKWNEFVNIDSQIPNKVAEEWIRSGHLFENPQVIRPETRYGNSRFDLYLENENSRMFLEVKGVTLEEEGVARFPDAPTERGVKHVEELIRCREEGYRAGILFVVQMKSVSVFEPNMEMQPEFGLALSRAAKAGVHILACDCLVTEDSMTIDQPVPIRLPALPPL